ncbi:MAG TPA: tetratricopeptide repeat protein [Candidatus Nitrosotenuis sp.]|nr:tetratricopeptide repeat protein [Candidatus Nitrosotenuis sp.]
MNKHKENGNRISQEVSPPAASNAWSPREAYLLATVCLLAGVVLGYLVRGSGSIPPAPANSVSAATSTSTSPPSHSAADLEPLTAPLLAALRADPKNADLLIQLGNLYYDHHVFPEAISYYSRALELRPKDVNVRTDMATAYWYSGDAKTALAEYDKSLQVDPNHAPTLMNIGIVRWNGLNDAAGAIAAWEKLLRVAPQFPDRQRVLDLIAQAKSGNR